MQQEQKAPTTEENKQNINGDEIPKLFHSGKVVRGPRHLKQIKNQQTLVREEKKNQSSLEKIPTEITSEEDYWSFRTNKLQQQRSESSAKKTCLDIYSNVVHKLKDGNEKENEMPLALDNSNRGVNTQLFSGLVFFFNSIRGSGPNSQYNLVKLASVHGATVL